MSILPKNYIIRKTERNDLKNGNEKKNNNGTDSSFNYYKL